MFGKNATLSVLSFVSLLASNVIAIAITRAITPIPIKETDRIFIKQRYISRIKNHLILAQASQKISAHILDIFCITKDKFEITSGKVFYDSKRNFSVLGRTGHFCGCKVPSR
jgi:hypothetical protein